MNTTQIFLIAITILLIFQIIMIGAILKLYSIAKNTQRQIQMQETTNDILVDILQEQVNANKIQCERYCKNYYS